MTTDGSSKVGAGATPRPWFRNRASIRRSSSIPSEQTLVARAFSYEDAAFIVTAVNEREALLEIASAAETTLVLAVIHVEEHCPPHDPVWQWIERTRSALLALSEQRRRSEK